MILQNNIEEIMKQKNITDSDLCEATGLTRMTIYNIKTRKTASLPTALKIAKALGEPIEKIWYFEDKDGEQEAA